ncbi:UDP-3-O-(3-hydroxymyristoyl)glucosamine N-acyltransferase [Sneathiella chinensis]|uniref:UDP-3-O-acylglucosamine N-acyltransferase n=1 Tax=Sneathiella chinensis TaxID=349750 RepID=A0ABQ5U716_9PROT|nr:UDP-3-O-(3-hydroxymyristoyl)glucosamine N-acyltransferase [Sneathiella chinensis]GLQ07206.1 UDP-3-O-acylglucosamine N-acyltransferase [Sneathiella chinensis]
MADRDFFDNKGPFPLSKLAELTGSRLEAQPEQDIEIVDVASLDSAGEGQIAFLSNPKYADAFATTKASACIVAEPFVQMAPKGMALLVSDNPYKAYARISALFYPANAGDGSIHPTAVVSPDATIGKNVSIGAYSVIESGVTIGDGTVIGHHVAIARNCRIGMGCNLHSQVTVQCAHIGDNVALYSGARIGEDGFGFAPDPAGHVKIPQLGRVIIGSSVEIGANTTIDRGAGPDTVIGDGCWIDNLCQIGHNVRLGRGCIIASQSGISGSTVVEDFVVLGGQVGVAGHLRIGMGAQLSGKSGVISDIPAGQVYAGFPARPRKEFFRNMAVLRKLAKGKGHVK